MKEELTEQFNKIMDGYEKEMTKAKNESDNDSYVYWLSRICSVSTQYVRALNKIERKLQ